MPELKNITPEQFENAKAAVVRCAQALVEMWRRVRAQLLKNMAKFMDGLLYAANTNPKWWHLYKHSKKRRVRKKYRDRLMRQLNQKLAAIYGETKEAKT